MRRLLLLPLLAFLVIAAGPAEESDRLLRAGQEQEAFAVVERGAAVGDIDSIDRLAWFYDNGEVVARDQPRAATLYRRAAEAGNSHAQWRLGVMLDMGEGVRSDPEEAVRWFVRAAAAGEVNAVTSLAVMHANGRGVRRDFAEAMRLYRDAAGRGGAHGFYGVGVMYALGQGVRTDPVEAVAWLAVAASLGIEDAVGAISEVGLADGDYPRAVERANAIVRETGVDAPTIVLGPSKAGDAPAEERPVPVV